MVTCKIWLLCAFFLGISAKDSALTNDASRARIDVLLFETAVNAEYTTKTYHLTGNFSPAGAKIGAEGEVLQFHPRGLCNDYDDDETEFGTVAVVNLESSFIDPHPCLSVYDKAKRAMHRGATAVIFIVTDSPAAVSQLEAEKSAPLDRPIVLLTGQDAHKLMEIVNKVEEAWARIQPPPQLSPDPSSNEFFDMGIFVAFFILISIICLLLVLKLRWRQKRKQSSQARQALNALSKMEVRKYCRNNEQRYSQKILPDDRWATTLSIASDGTICAICLEEFREGEELRIVPCAHEFHKHCVDPWLLSNRTCPLCMFNILDCGIEGKSPDATPSGHVSPVDQQLRVSLPNSPTRDASWEGVYAAPPSHHHHRTPSSSHHHHHHHHKHSRSRCSQSLSKREHRSAVVSGSNVREGAPRLPSSSQSQLERWFGRGPLTWQSNCEYVCSHCHRHINCNGQYNSSCVTPRQLGLASFESHYVVNSSYVPWSGGGGGGGVNCSRGASGRRGVSQGTRHYRDQCHVPVQVHLEAVTSTACQKGATNHQLRGSDSGSSLSLSAFNADFECSDSTSSPENFDSTQSVYGSSTTCHSEVTGCDPCVYSRPGVVQQYWKVGPPAQLTPSCLHKSKIQNSNHNQNSTSDSDDQKRSGSDANASASSGSNFSTRVNTSRKDGIQPYRPQSSVSTVTTPDSVSSQVRTNHVCSPSSKTPTPSDSKTTTPNTITPQTHYPQPLPKSSDSSRQQTPCACCGDNEVWDQRSPASPEDKTPSGDKPERGVKGQRRSSRGTPTRKPRGHLTLPVQSVATLKNTQGTVITMPVQGTSPAAAANTSRKVMEEIV